MGKLKKLLFVLGIIVVAGISGVVADRYIFPHLAVTKFFAKYAFFKKAAEDVTIINKTEQVFVKEDVSVSKIASQVAPSVVNIISSTGVPADKKLPASTAIKNGTGLVATSDGLIMTYASAIFLENAKYKVITSDNNVYDATLTNVDSYSNLAFLKINASNLPAVSFGNSDDVISGQKIIAIGNSSGAYNSFFAAGILGNLNYVYNLSENAIASSEKMEGVFETDLDRGENYVGGPIVDYSGQAIGITGTNMRDGKNVYFQLQANKIKTVLDKEIRKELGTNPILGIYYLSITKTYALVNNLPVESGALIFSPSAQQGLAIIANSSAAKAGLKLNDIIVSVAGEKIDQTHSLPDLLYKHKKGEQLDLSILRNSLEMTVSVAL